MHSVLNSLILKSRRGSLLLGVVFAATQPISANVISWSDWSSYTGSTVHGTISLGSTTIDIDHSGLNWFVQTGTGTNYWTEGNPKPYTGNALISNAPTAAEMIALNYGTTNTITFSRAVVNPIMTIVSMGQPGLPVTYDFDTPFSVLSEGRGYWGDGTYSLLSGDRLEGRELHAAIQFIGTVSQVSWTSSAEGWHGFTFGLDGASQPVPDGATTVLLLAIGLGVMKFGWLRRQGAR